MLGHKCDGLTSSSTMLCEGLGEAAGSRTEGLFLIQARQIGYSGALVLN